MNKKINILGIYIDAITKKEAIGEFENFFIHQKKIIIATINPEFIMNAQKDSEFRDILNSCNLKLADGMGLLWAAKFNSIKFTNIPILRTIQIFFVWTLSLLFFPIFLKLFKSPIPERIAGVDFVWEIARYSNNHKLGIFLLGSGPTIAERTALELQTQIYGLKISGVHSGGTEDTKEIIKSVNHSKADILMVAFGSPKQERWLDENLKKTTARVGIGVGGSFDFISGLRKRAPKIFQISGFEWLYRLLQEPKRFKRQLNLPKFAFMILYEKLFKNVTTKEI